MKEDLAAEGQQSEFEPGVTFKIEQARAARSSEVEVRRVPGDMWFAESTVTLPAEQVLQGLPRDLASTLRADRKQYPANRRVIARAWNCRLQISAASTSSDFRDAISAAKQRLGLVREEFELRTSQHVDADRELDQWRQTALEDPAVRSAAEALAIDFGLLNVDFVLESILQGEPAPLHLVSWGDTTARAIQSSRYKDWEAAIGRVPWERLNAQREWERTSEHFLAAAARSLVKVVIAPPPPPPLTSARAVWESAPLSSVWIHVGAANTEIDLRAVWPDIMNLKKRLATSDSSASTRAHAEPLHQMFLPDQPQRPAHFAFEVHCKMTFEGASALFRLAVSRRRELRGGSIRRYRRPLDPGLVTKASGEPAPDFDDLAKGSKYHDGAGVRKAVRRSKSRLDMAGMDGAPKD